MTYCTIYDLQLLLPEKIQIGDQNLGTPQPGRTATKRSNFTPTESKVYISYGQQYIDGRLRPFYSCPLRRIKSYETPITSDISRGTNVNVSVRDSGAFVSKELVRLQDKSRYETAEVVDVPDLTTVTLKSVEYDYAVVNDTEISVLEFPDPIPIITARLAVSFMMDKLFSAEQSPDVSNYGKTQRNLARNSLDDILSGAILLFGQELTGRRFVRGTLFDAYNSPAEVTKGDEKE